MITASIVTYHHHFKDIRKVIECILSSPVSILYIIDNSSNDRLRELAKISAKIKYIHSVNLGYGAGHNIAIRESIDIGATYHIVVNPDIYFEEGVIEKLIIYMNKYSEVGLVMPRVLYPNGELQYLCKLLPTPFDLLFRRFLPWRRYVEKKNEKYEPIYRDIENSFQSFFGTKVKLNAGQRRGKIIIEYASNDDLERILDLIK